MPKFGIELPHSLGKDDAKSRLERFIESYREQVTELEQSWQDDTLSFSFKTFGIKIAGDMIVSEDHIVVDGDLPFSAMMFKGKIEGEMKEKLERILS